MLTNVKTWLETTGYPVAESLFLKAQAPPYIVYQEAIKIRGSDQSNLIADRSITIELYTETIDGTAEGEIEKLLDSITHDKNRVWIDSQLLFETIYDFNLTEKI